MEAVAGTDAVQRGDAVSDEVPRRHRVVGRVVGEECNPAARRALRRGEAKRGASKHADHTRREGVRRAAARCAQ